MNKPWVRMPLLQAALLPLAAAALMAIQPTALAATEAACKVKSRSDRVVVMVCPPSATAAVMKAAGEAACKGKTGGCNAWIWDDAAKAPPKAPAIDTDMPKTTTGNARAVWLHDSQNLMEVRKAR
jgi:hypothetical protein